MTNHATKKDDELVLRAMRLAEQAHRSRNHTRKAPPGEDRPSYFLHLAEVAWLLQEAQLAQEVVAAGYVHDMIEDCDYNRDDLAVALGNGVVADLVAWVSEPSGDRRDPEAWEKRNTAYAAKLAKAPAEALALSCADKTANLLDMIRLIEKGYSLEDFVSRGYASQLLKFDRLDDLFRGRVPGGLYQRYKSVLDKFRASGVQALNRSSSACATV